MINGSFPLFWPVIISIVLLFIIGFYCLFFTNSLIRALIGIEILIKGVTLFIILAGKVTDHVAQAQAIVITMIVIEVVFIVVATGVVIGLHKNNGSLDIRKVSNLKG
jgi:NADH:ubiquinone oxidoreductase subunit K